MGGIFTLCKEEIIHSRDCSCENHCRYCLKEFTVKSSIEDQLHIECIKPFENYIVRINDARLH